jgi:histidine phosphotransferase ChpT
MKTVRQPSATVSGDEPDLVALLGSRLCHDLISPVGAIGNGLELLEMTGVGREAREEMALIRHSVEAALARIRFFRIAFGAGKSGGAISAREMRGIVDAMYRDTRTKVLWRDEADRPRAEMRLACLALCCVEVATPWGATVELSRPQEAWVIHVDAERLKIDALLWESLGRGPLPSDLAGSEVQFGILRRASRDLNRSVTVSADERHLSLLV